MFAEILEPDWQFGGGYRRSLSQGFDRRVADDERHAEGPGSIQAIGLRR